MATIEDLYFYFKKFKKINKKYAKYADEFKEMKKFRFDLSVEEAENLSQIFLSTISTLLNNDLINIPYSECIFEINNQTFIAKQDAKEFVTFTYVPDIIKGSTTALNNQIVIAFKNVRNKEKTFQILDFNLLTEETVLLAEIFVKKKKDIDTQIKKIKEKDNSSKILNDITCTKQEYTTLHGIFPEAMKLYGDKASVLIEFISCSITNILGLLTISKCKNVSLKKVIPKRYSGKKNNYGKPIFAYHTLELTPNYKEIESLDSKLNERNSPRLHLRRGHIRHYKSGKMIWINHCFVGDPTKGSIDKDYHIKG